jgi:hypothetical protein
MTCCVAA